MTKWERFRATWIFRKARAFILLGFVTLLFPLAWADDVKNKIFPRVNLREGYRRIWNEEV